MPAVSTVSTTSRDHGRGQLDSSKSLPFAPVSALPMTKTIMNRTISHEAASQHPIIDRYCDQHSKAMDDGPRTMLLRTKRRESQRNRPIYFQQAWNNGWGNRGRRDPRASSPLNHLYPHRSEEVTEHRMVASVRVSMNLP